MSANFVVYFNYRDNSLAIRLSLSLPLSLYVRESANNLYSNNGNRHDEGNDLWILH